MDLQPMTTSPCRHSPFLSREENDFPQVGKLFFISLYFVRPGTILVSGLTFENLIYLF